jgi:hypothetical protein
MHQPAPEIYNTTTRWFVPDGRTVYIATDEKNRSYFAPFQDHYNIVFLDNFQHLLRGINPNYYGMIDQLVASKAHVFVGALYSTFTGYINRLRGYHAQQDKIEGYEEGKIRSYYYEVRTATAKYDEKLRQRTKTILASRISSVLERY